MAASIGEEHETEAENSVSNVGTGMLAFGVSSIEDNGCSGETMEKDPYSGETEAGNPISNAHTGILLSGVTSTLDKECRGETSEKDPLIGVANSSTLNTGKLMDGKPVDNCAISLVPSNSTLQPEQRNETPPHKGESSVAENMDSDVSPGVTVSQVTSSESNTCSTELVDKGPSEEVLGDSTLWIKQEKDDSLEYEDETAGDEINEDFGETEAQSEGITEEAMEQGPSEEAQEDLSARIKSENTDDSEIFIKQEPVDLTEPSTSGACSADVDDYNSTSEIMDEDDDSCDRAAGDVKEERDVPTEYLTPCVKVECDDSGTDFQTPRNSGEREIYLLHDITPNPIQINLKRIDRYGRIACPYCKFRTTGMDTLTNHITKIHKEKIMFCEYEDCGWSTTVRAIMKRHIMEKHTFEKPYACPYCPEAFIMPNPLKLHMVDHDTSRPHLCDRCDHVANSAYELKMHIRQIHRQKKYFYCTSCDFASLRVREVTYHEKLFHSNEVAFFCPHCPYTTSRKIVLRYHVRVNHETVFPRRNKGSRRFLCPMCDFLTPSSPHLRDHMIREHSDERYTCSECGRKFLTSTILKTHMARHSGVSVSQTGNLANEKAPVQVNKKLLKCPYCSKFKTDIMDDLHKHVVEEHSEERPHACPFCDFRSVQPGGLSYHIGRKHNSAIMSKELTISSEKSSPVTTPNSKIIPPNVTTAALPTSATNSFVLSSTLPGNATNLFVISAATLNSPVNLVVPLRGYPITASSKDTTTTAVPDSVAKSILISSALPGTTNSSGVVSCPLPGTTTNSDVVSCSLPVGTGSSLVATPAVPIPCGSLSDVYVTSDLPNVIADEVSTNTALSLVKHS